MTSGAFIVSPGDRLRRNLRRSVSLFGTPGDAPSVGLCDSATRLPDAQTAPVAAPQSAHPSVVRDHEIEGTSTLQRHDPHSTVLFRNFRVRRLPDNGKTPPSKIPQADDTFRQVLELSRQNVPVVDFHTPIKGALKLEDVLRRSYRGGIYPGIAVNGGKGFPTENDQGIERFRLSMEGQPAFIAMQAGGREWLNLFSPQSVAKFDYVFTDSMT